MPHAAPYDRQFNFQNQQLLTPEDPLPADEIDSELNAIKLTLDQIISNMELIQRHDGALANQSVGRDTLHSSIQLGFGAPTVWHESTRYVADFDTIFKDAFFYKCIETHVSDPSPLGFDNDLAKWELIADFSVAAIEGLGTMSTQNASNVIITGGTIATTTITVATPDAAIKAANKQYVDDAITALMVLLRGELNAPSGTRAVFQQTAAPLGWTKDTTHNDKALRIISGTVGSGGASPFSTVFGKTATDAFTLLQAHLPSVTLSTSIGAGQGSHTHDINSGPMYGGISGGSAGGTGNTVPVGVQVIGITNAALPAMTGTTALGGSNTPHAHAMDIRVQYVDCIICQKD